MIVADDAIPKQALRIGGMDAHREIGFTIVLSPRTAIPEVHADYSERKHLGTKPPQAAHLNHVELRQIHGAHPSSVELIESFARRFALEVREAAPHRRSMRLRGRAVDVGRAFGTSFDDFEFAGHRFFAPVSPLSIPANWHGAVEAILGLQCSDRMRPRRRSVVREGKGQGNLKDLALAYSFPPGMDGSGQTIGIIEFGGGFHPKDIEQFCSRSGIAVPRITVVELAGGANRPASGRAVHEFLDAASGKLALSAKAEQSDSFAAAQCTVEVTMDLEVIAGLAPGAHIIVYFASTEEQGFYHAINQAVHDEQHRPDILSISWNLPEETIPNSELHAIEEVLREAAHLGITICVSSGDSGALNGSPDGKPSVNYPASSSHCLACGGTSGKLDGTKIQEEVVWNATHYGIKCASGGGVSRRLPLPVWQEDAGVPAGPEGQIGRGVPDVAALADPRYGCGLLIANRTFPSAGTSAVAPMWAALIARLNQALGQRCGHLHPHLYKLGKQRMHVLHPVLKGNNGLYHAGEGWNACTGYGSPRGTDLLSHLQTWLKG